MTEFRSRIVLSKEDQREMSKPHTLSALYERSPKIRMPFDPELAVVVVAGKRHLGEDVWELEVFDSCGEETFEVRTSFYAALILKRGDIVAFGKGGEVVHMFSPPRAFMEMCKNGQVVFVSGEDTFVPFPPQLHESEERP